MSEGTYNRRPVRFIEIEQPRCSNRFGVAVLEPAGASDHSYVDQDTISFADYDREADVLFAADVVFGATPAGLIMELGGSATGCYLGVTSGELVWRVGSGSSGGDAQTAMVRRDVADLAGLTVTIVAQVIMPDQVRLSVLNADGELVFTETGTASSGGLSGGGRWAGGNDGGFGKVVGTVVLGESTASFAGTLTALRAYESSVSFPVSGCTATGTPKCYQTFWTCLDRANYDPDGFIRWRFYDGENGSSWLYEEFTDANEIGTNAFPALKSASTQASRVNVGGQSQNESPFGKRSKLTIKLREFEFDDHVGDFYTADRTIITAGFWAKFMARNPYYPNMRVRDYQGYEGDALADMVTREYVLDNIEQTSPNEVTITARDPLDLASDKKAQFPRASDIQLFRKLNDSSTDIDVLCVESELSADFGNTGSTRYMRFGSEIIRYTGWTGTAPDFTLTGVERGVLGTAASSHSIGDSGQRVGRFESIRMYRVARRLLENHTTIPAEFFDFTQWEAEGETWRPSLVTSATISEPVAVETLIAELSRDGLFYIWWDERDQKIPMRAIRPPQDTPEQWTDDKTIIKGSFEERAESDDFLTRVVLFYNRRDPTVSLEDENNFLVQSLRIDAELEADDATGGAVRERTIFSRWINTDSNALLVAAQLMLQYKFIPRYLTVQIDAKDRAIGIADVVDMDTRHKVDSEGNKLAARYQVIEVQEDNPGHSLTVEMQSFQFVGKFAVIMANDATDYATATAAEKLSGCWIAENTGIMPDGTEPYLLQ